MLLAFDRSYTYMYRFDNAAGKPLRVDLKQIKHPADCYSVKIAAMHDELLVLFQDRTQAKLLAYNLQSLTEALRAERSQLDAVWQRCLDIPLPQQGILVDQIQAGEHSVAQ
jgi:hypothetical protein